MGRAGAATRCTIHSFEIGAWGTSAGDVDVLPGIPGASRRNLLRYEEFAKNAVELRIDRIRVLVASLTNIIRSKEVTGRPKDREALDELRSLRDRQRQDRREWRPDIYGHLRTSSDVSTQCRLLVGLAGGSAADGEAPIAGPRGHTASGEAVV